MKTHDDMATDQAELIPTRWSLIKRLKNWDDQESWRVFFDTYWRLIYGTSIKAGLTDAEAQEVVQETVISVCRKIEGFEATAEAGSFKAWLLKLTHWRIVDQIRKRRHEKPPLARSSDETGTSTTGRVIDPSGLELGRVWDEEWESNLIQAALERVQRQTSAKHYQVFYLYAIRQAEAEQVAKVTGVAVEQVYLLKNRILPLFEKAVRAVEHNQP